MLAHMKPERWAPRNSVLNRHVPVFQPERRLVAFHCLPRSTIGFFPNSETRQVCFKISPLFRAWNVDFTTAESSWGGGFFLRIAIFCTGSNTRLEHFPSYWVSRCNRHRFVFAITLAIRGSYDLATSSDHRRRVLSTVPAWRLRLSDQFLGVPPRRCVDLGEMALASAVLSSRA